MILIIFKVKVNNSSINHWITHLMFNFRIKDLSYMANKRLNIIDIRPINNYYDLALIYKIYLVTDNNFLR